MKRTFNINLSGEPFVIDDDAYVLLNNYIETLTQAFENNPDGGTITSDIEQRFSELFLEKIETGKKVITIEDVKEVMDRIGRPEEFLDCDEFTIEKEHEGLSNETAKQGTMPPPPPIMDNNTPGIKKRFFRDIDDKVLGGVCSGFAHYIGVDPVWVRLISGLIFIFSYSSIMFVYLLLWIIVPPADTPVKRLEMFGEAPTLYNIRREVSETNINTKQNTFLNILQILVKLFMACLGICALVVVIGTMIGFVCLVVLLIALPFGINFPIIPEFESLNSPLALDLIVGVAATIAAGLPALAIVWCAISMFTKKMKFSKTWVISLAIIWVISLIVLIIGGLSISKNINGNIERLNDNRIEMIVDPVTEEIDRFEHQLDSLQQRADSLTDILDNLDERD